MELAGEQRIAAPRQRVWEALNDPDILRASIPGCQSLEKVSDESFKAVVEVKIGPIGARFTGAVTLSERDPPNGYTITGEGNGGITGSAKGGAKVRLSDDKGGTLLSYHVEAQVGGRLAQLGGPIIDATAKQLAGKFFQKFGESLNGAPGSAPIARAAGVGETQPRVSRRPGGLPVAWLLGLALAGLAGFELGRWSASPVIVLDAATLARLTDGARQ